MSVTLQAFSEYMHSIFVTVLTVHVRRICICVQMNSELQKQETKTLLTDVHLYQSGNTQQWGNYIESLNRHLKMHRTPNAPRTGKNAFIPSEQNYCQQMMSQQYLSGICPRYSCSDVAIRHCLANQVSPIIQVVDCEDAMSIMAITPCHWGRLPVVTMHDVRPDVEDFHVLKSSPAKETKPSGIILAAIDAANPEHSIVRFDENHIQAFNLPVFSRR